MKKPILLGLLVLANLVLAAWLLAGAKFQSSSEQNARALTDQSESGAPSSPATNELIASRPSKNQRGGPAVPLTAFAMVYSSDPNQFAANLRAIHCPGGDHQRYSDRRSASLVSDAGGRVAADSGGSCSFRMVSENGGAKIA